MTSFRSRVYLASFASFKLQRKSYSIHSKFNQILANTRLNELSPLIWTWTPIVYEKSMGESVDSCYYVNFNYINCNICSPTSSYNLSLSFLYSCNILRSVNSSFTWLEVQVFFMSSIKSFDIKNSSKLTRRSVERINFQTVIKIHILVKLFQIKHCILSKSMVTVVTIEYTHRFLYTYTYA